MKTKIKIIILLFLIVTCTINISAQRKYEFGLTTGAVRFYPEVQHLGSSPNNSMENGLGWSAGVYIQDNWKPRLSQIVELNYYSMHSDIYLEKFPTGPHGGQTKPIVGDFKNTSFSTLSLSAGVKYFLRKSLFVYPSFEIARSLNKKIDINKTSYNATLGVGIDLKKISVLLEYAYGLKYQRLVYDPAVPFASTHRNKYLQLKVQVPIINM